MDKSHGYRFRKVLWIYNYVVPPHVVTKGHLACHYGDTWPPVRVWGRDLHHWAATKGMMDRTLGGVKGLKRENLHCEGAEHMAGKIFCSLFSLFSLLLYFWEGLINLPKLWKVRSCFSHAPYHHRWDAELLKQSCEFAEKTSYCK